MINVGCSNSPKPTLKVSLERRAMMFYCTVGFPRVQLSSKVSYEMIIYFFFTSRQGQAFVLPRINFILML